jgi:hypothetical protein
LELPLPPRGQAERLPTVARHHTAAGVSSNARIIGEQLAWLAGLFGGKKATYSDDMYDINIGSGIMEGVGLADGTDDVESVPPLILGPVAQLLGGWPPYRLSLSIHARARWSSSRAPVSFFAACWRFA